jgi:hypothetical protein
MNMQGTEGLLQQDGANRWPESAFRSRFLQSFYKYFRLFRQTALVTVDGAFYNPSNAALEAVVSFIRTPRSSTAKTVALSDGECMNIDLHFGSSQEH